MSLRLRLVLIILGPLVLITLLIGAWAVTDSQNRAAERFDRSLLSAALAISRDVAVSGGDALSAETSALLRDTSGGPVFYHVFAPDGVFVTGYATPPVPPGRAARGTAQQIYFDGVYQGNPVRVLRFVDAMQIDGLTGNFTFTVWQDTSLRSAIVRDLSWRTFQVMATLVIAVVLVVWFGVRFGLRPLLDLERAIGRRSSDDLDPIKRRVPVEAQGIVQRLNLLFGQVSQALETKDAFISNAAHQLRNPIAGVVAMAEAVRSARTFEDMKTRTEELAIAARHAGDLANKLLTLERAASGTDRRHEDVADLRGVVTEAARRMEARAAARDVTLTLSLPETPVALRCDGTMVHEAATNLIDNALTHAGPDLTRIDIALSEGPEWVTLTVSDDGAGIDPNLIDKMKERFAQADRSTGSGLGLAIAEAVAKRHGGALEIRNGTPGLICSLRFGREG